MDLSDPTRALVPTLDGPVLAVLAGAGRPLTVGEIAQQAARGSEIGVRRSVARLVDQGIVTATQMGRNVVHELNRDHVAAPAAALLAGLRLELWKRLRSELAGWAEKPVHATVFGSAARGDGGPASDIDLLLVHRPFPGDETPQLPSSGWLRVLQGVAWAATGTPGSPTVEVADTKAWHTAVDELHRRVQRWTGNPLHTVELSAWQWTMLPSRDPAFYHDLRRDGVVVAGTANPPTIGARA